MTARVDLQSKVPVSLEKLSYFSQYPSIVSRSLWDPLAPGVLGGARDLAGRAVIVTAVLLGCYLILSLFIKYILQSTPSSSEGISKNNQKIADEQQTANLRRLAEVHRASKRNLEHLCGPKNLSDICTGLHTHHQSSNLDLSLDKEKILHLCDVENLKDEECLYPEDKLTDEISHIESLMKKDNTQRLMKYFSFEKDPMQYALGALFVLLGIKPALAIEIRPDKELLSILTDLANEHSNLCLKNESSTLYFVNEEPLSSFHPRNFLNLSSEVLLMDAVPLCFSEQGHWEADQFLSYLLGFGPSWEIYATTNDYFYREQDSASCMFNNNHYYEIGNVLNQFLFNKDEDRSEIEKLGFTFHSQLASLIKKHQWKKNVFLEREIAPKTMLSITGTSQALDGLTARTDYFKKSYTLKKRVMETYFPQLF
jgi:hypothetical protein